jgi:hypothetical protein
METKYGWKQNVLQLNNFSLSLLLERNISDRLILPFILFISHLHQNEQLMNLHLGMKEFILNKRHNF